MNMAVRKFLSSSSLGVLRATLCPPKRATERPYANVRPLLTAFPSVNTPPFTALELFVDWHLRLDEGVGVGGAGATGVGVGVTSDGAGVGVGVGIGAGVGPGVGPPPQG